jgi:HK97 family phage major capsid protein/HK97 family phage prohead protease
MDRAYSVLEIKNINEGKRILTGTATTPTTDRAGDIVEPDGAEFKLPIPFLWQHDRYSPVGNVTKAKVTKRGIDVEIQLAQTDEPGLVKDRLDMAWHDIKLGLVRGLSIGFSAIELADIAGTWGIRFTKWLWLELSAVTIPANGDCSIETIKSVDSAVRAALGKKDAVNINRLLLPGASGPDRVKAISVSTKQAEDPKDPAMLKKYLDALKAAEAKQDGLMKAADARGETLNADEDAEFIRLDGEIAGLKAHVTRLEAMEKRAADTVKALPQTPADKANANGAEPRRPYAAAKSDETVAPGIRFARWAKMIGLATKTHRDIIALTERHYPNDRALINVVRNQDFILNKANVPAGANISGNWAEDLVGDATSVFADFVEYLRPQTILGKFGTNGIPSLRRVPFRVPLISQTAGGAGYWVGEGAAKPLTSFDFARTTLEPLKVANIAVLTMEILRDSSPSAETIIRDELANALRARLDTDFIDPDKAASAGVSPASITNGVTPIGSTGNDADAIRQDIRAAVAAFVAANNPLTSGVWIMSANTALALSLLRNPLGQQEFTGIGVMGGTLEGMPIIVSEYVPSETAGGFAVLMNAQDIYFADDGDVSVDMSTEASLEMDNAPSSNSYTPTESAMVSMFQTNSAAFRAERTVNWAKRRTTAVVVINAVNWGLPTT